MVRGAMVSRCRGVQRFRGVTDQRFKVPRFKVEGSKVQGSRFKVQGSRVQGLEV